jgi:transposase
LIDELLRVHGIDIRRMDLTLPGTMRGEDKKQSSMLVLMSPETRVPQTHPLRAIKKLADEALAKLSPTFDAMYADGGRPSIPPERLLKSMLLTGLYTVRSERQFCEQLDYNLRFRGFLDMDMVEKSFVPTVFSHNRDRLMAHDAAGEFLRAHAERRNALEMLDNNVPGQRRITVGGDKGYDTKEFVADCRAQRHAAGRAEHHQAARLQHR